MGIIQQIFPDQFLKIPCLHLTFQELKCGDRLHMDKRFLLIVEPAVEQLEAVHQSPRIISEVRLPEAEFVIVNSCTERFLIHTVPGNLSERILDHTDKLFLLLHVRILRYHRENRLVHTIIIRTHDILSYACVKERFLKRSARC